MLDTHLSYLKIIRNIMRLGIFTDTLAVLRRLDIFIWCKVIRNKGNFIFIKYCLLVELFNLVNRYRTGNIVSKNEIKICHDKLSRLNRLQSCMCR